MFSLPIESVGEILNDFWHSDRHRVSFITDSFSFAYDPFCRYARLKTRTGGASWDIARKDRVRKLTVGFNDFVTITKTKGAVDDVVVRFSIPELTRGQYTLRRAILSNFASYQMGVGVDALHEFKLPGYVLQAEQISELDFSSIRFALMRGEAKMDLLMAGGIQAYSILVPFPRAGTQLCMHVARHKDQSVAQLHALVTSSALKVAVKQWLNRWETEVRSECKIGAQTLAAKLAFANARMNWSVGGTRAFENGLNVFASGHSDYSVVVGAFGNVRNVVSGRIGVRVENLRSVPAKFSTVWEVAVNM